MDNQIVSSMKRALEAKYKAVKGQAYIPIYAVIDYGDGDVLGAHFDKQAAEAARDDLIDVYTLTEVIEDKDWVLEPHLLKNRLVIPWL